MANRYVAFLRAINVGGHVVKMDRLRALFVELGFDGVETFIASGNVIFDAGRASAGAIERRIERHLAKSLGYEVATFVRSVSELASIAVYEPFGAGAVADDKGSLMVGFVGAPLPAERIRALAALETDTDRLHAKGREVWWLARAGVGKSPLGMAKLERALGGPATFRNVTTVRRLAALDEPAASAVAPRRPRRAR